MDFPHWLNGMAPFMIAASTARPDRAVNRIRIVESVVSAIVIAVITTSLAAYITLRIVETQTAELTAADDEKGKQIVVILTQMATVQATLAGVAQQQAAFEREMHERLLSLERRPAAAVEPAYRAPTRAYQAERERGG